MNSSIGILQESSLHAGIKELYMSAGAKSEVEVDGFIVDVVQDDLLIEVQTSNFSKIKGKLSSLLKNHKVRLVYPIASEKWIVHQSPDCSTELSRRKSPKKMSYVNMFDELVSLPNLLVHSNLSLDVLLIKEEDIRCKDGRGSWRRRGWSTIDRKLIEVVESRSFEHPTDFLQFIPKDLKKPFTNSELAKALRVNPRVARRITYCLRKMSALRVVGKEGNALLLSE